MISRSLFLQGLWRWTRDVAEDGQGKTLTVDYAPTFLFYTDQSSYNEVNQAARLSGQLDLAKLSLGFGQGFVYSTDPVVDVGQRTDRLSYDTLLNSRYPLAERLSLDLNGTFRLEDYDEFNKLLGSGKPGLRELPVVVSLIQNSPPVDKILPRSQLGLMGRFFLLQGMPILSAEQVESAPAPPIPPEPGETVEYGQYLAALCAICHGQDLTGVYEPGGGTNLTPGGELGSWTEEDFISALRTGVEPDGSMIDQELMPTRICGKLNESELRALWMYLQTLPPVVKPTATPTE